jgi:sugar phosphate isomerase/epimerase
MKTRRDFIKGSLLASGALLTGASVEKLIAPAPDIKFSLAEWSFNRSLYAGRMDHLDFPSVAKKEFGITAVEYVNGFFGGKKMEFREAAKNMAYLNELLKRSQDAGVINHLLMVDDEGPLSSTVEKERIESVENHKKWLEAAKILGCLTVRVNLHGEGNPDDRKKASVDSLGRLGEFARPMNLNVVVENHGSVTSNAEWLTDVMKQVGMKNIGTLPDFGNWCISHPWGTIQNGCDDMYDIYKGIKLLLPYAKGVSAKSYDFDAGGEQPLLDYKKLVGIVKESGYKGYIGIEYEGLDQNEYEGVRKTQKLLSKYL